MQEPITVVIMGPIIRCRIAALDLVRLDRCNQFWFRRHRDAARGWNDKEYL